MRKPTSFKARRQLARSAQKGVSLIEVLIAVLILSLGLLGMAGMQARAIKSNQSSYARSQAVMLSYYMLDAMRADRTNAVTSTAYNTAKVCNTSTFTGSTLADRTRADWINALKTNLGDLTTTCGGISCTGGICTIDIFWDDSLAGGLGTQQFTTSSRL